MSKYSTLVKRVSSATTALALSLASLTPAVMLGSRASAGQMTERSITMSDSLKGDDDNTYTVSFKNETAGTVEGIVVEFCTNSPIIGTACTAPAGLDVAGSTTPQTIDTKSYAVAMSTNKATLTTANDDGSAAGAGETYSFTLNVDNPSDVDSVTGGDQAGTFYARVLTFSTFEAANAYDDELPGSYVDAGGVALSTTEDVTINARVQERLEFCVGADADASGVVNCGDIDGTTIDLGVLSTSAINNTPTGNGAGVDGNSKEGVFQVSTNAFYGVKIYYYSENSLRVGSVECNDGDENTTNQCFNSSDASVLIAAGTEKFGMRVSEITDKSEVAGEDNLAAVSPYGGANHAWNTDSATEIAKTKALVTDPGVVSKDNGTLEFAATSSLTTPSGYYTTSANFIAVASF